MHRVVTVALLLILATLSAYTQDINTIVGGGSPLGPTPLSTYVGTPTDVVKDSLGNVYFSALDEEYVFKLNVAGKVTIVAGVGYGGWVGVGGPATKATLTSPTGLALDSRQDLYIADWFNQHIYEVNATTGVLTNIAGSAGPNSPLGGYSGDGGPATSAQLNFPQGVAVLGNSIAIADTSNNVIRLVNSTTGVITTYAGVQSAPCLKPTTKCGDGGPATSANLNGPINVAFDAAGNLYIADSNDNRIRRVSKTGTISTVAGDGTACPSSASSCGDNGPATKANLYFPAKVIVDSSGDLYIADEYDNKIRFVNATTHIISTLVGTGAYGFGGDGGPATSASLTDPTGLFLDGSGNLLIADQGSNRIRQVTGGEINSIAGGGTGGDGGPPKKSIFSFLYDLTLDPNRNEYMIDFDSGRIRLFSSTTKTITTIVGNGTNGYSGDGGPATGPDATLDYPRGVALDSSGDLYIADSANWVVRWVQNGILNTYAGNGNGCFPSTGICGDGGPATQANLTYPEGVVVNAAGDLYIADTDDNRIRMVDNSSQHIISTIAGTGVACPLSTGSNPCGDAGPATSAELNTPTGIAIDSAGNIYIADSFDNRIRVINTQATAIVIAGVSIGPGDINTVAFNGESTFGGDNGPATLASMQAPNKLAVDPSGNIYVGGGDDNVVQKIDTAGIVTTVAGDANNPLAFGFSGDGGPATSATLSNRGLAVDTIGGLYIADNNRVRYVKVGP